MNKHQYLKGLAKKVSKTATVCKAMRENVDDACCCRSRQSRVEVEIATLATQSWWMEMKRWWNRWPIWQCE
jgi:hypothetical protein